jgi:hypothetical protein
MFSREQYEQLRSFPEISRDELFRYFTLTPAEVAFVDPGAGRVQRTGSGWLSSSRRCRGSGSCQATSPQPRLRLSPGWPGNWGWTRGHFRGMGNGLRLARTT